MFFSKFNKKYRILNKNIVFALLRLTLKKCVFLVLAFFAWTDSSELCCCFQLFGGVLLDVMTMGKAVL